MKRNILLSAAVLGAVCALATRPALGISFHQFQEQHQANEGEQAFTARNYAEAYEIFSALASTATSPEIAALAEARAAVSLWRKDENRYEEALSRARAVADRAYGVQATMELMIAREDYQQLVDEFRDEDIAAWPERLLPTRPRVGSVDARALALFDRGRAFLETGDTPAAERDIEQAVEFAGRHQKLVILSFLSRQVYGRLGLTDKAFENNMRILEMRSGYSYTLLAGTSSADYLRERERYDEALEVVEQFAWRSMTGGSWFYRFANLEARIQAESGDLEAAKKVYRELLTRDFLPDSQRERTEAALAGLEEEKSENGEG